MKTTSYRLQSEIEHLSPSSQKAWFKNYLKEVLESSKPYYAKSDYIARSFMELDNKIDYLTREIQSLTELKKKLQQAKNLGLEIAAETLQQYGVDKMEGTVISSLTIAPAKTKTKETVRIKDPLKVMELGYVTFSVDEKAVKEAVHDTETFAELDPYVDVSIEEEQIPAKLKINKRRNASTIPAADIAEILVAA